MSEPLHAVNKHHFWDLECASSVIRGARNGVIIGMNRCFCVKFLQIPMERTRLEYEYYLPVRYLGIPACNLLQNYLYFITTLYRFSSNASACHLVSLHQIPQVLASESHTYGRLSPIRSCILQKERMLFSLLFLCLFVFQAALLRSGSFRLVF